MSSLEQSLDAIIAHSAKPGRKPVRRNVKGAKRPQVLSKTVVARPRTGLRKTVARPTAPVARRPVAPPAAPQPRLFQSASLDVATKVVVSGLPKDIKNDVIREFFQSTIGSVQNLTLAYNEKGRSTGVATVIFKNAKAAQAAVSRYNNAAIDSGRSKLKLELVVDTTKVPLAARIQPNARPATLQNRIQPPRKARVEALKGRPGRPVNRPTKIANKRKETPKKPVKKKKTLEELDQEMADYFATND
ncbi:hypothetical protein PICMEDRAFT_15034, partial [Pichia membranifaciens NRRL Y-2026]